MKYNPEHHHRRSIRLKKYDYSSAGLYFITICMHERKCVFGDIQDGKIILNELGKIVEKEWKITEDIRENVKLDEFVVMPNHFHGILVITGSVGSTRWVDQNDKGAIQQIARTLPPNSLGSILGQFKSVVTKQIRQYSGFENFKWQRNYYERIIRDEDELNRIREYIIGNPLKWDEDMEHPNWNPHFLSEERKKVLKKHYNDLFL